MSSHQSPSSPDGSSSQEALAGFSRDASRIPLRTDAADRTVLDFFRRLHSPPLDVLVIALSDLVFYPVVLRITIVVSWL